MTRPRRVGTVDPPVRIEVGAKHTAHVYGGTRVWGQAVMAGIPHAMCPWCRTLMIPANRAQDLATHLILRGKPVTVQDFLL